MTNTIRHIAHILSAITAGMLASGCDAGFLEINRNPNEVYDEQMDARNYRTGTKVTDLQGYVVPVEEHLYQFVESLAGGPFAGYIGATNTWVNKFETFNPSADWRKAPFADVITESYAPYRELMASSDDEVTRAFALVLKVCIMSRVTDSYGPIPYSRLENNDKIYVAYDTQEEVYMRMMEELDEAAEGFRNNLSLGTDSWSMYDNVYYGDISKWYRFTNSMKLRLAIRMSYAAPETARARAEEAIAAGVMETNEDNAMLHAAENRAALIYNEWNDHRVGADIICYMNGYNDPRREKMFTSIPGSGSGGSSKTFKGVRIGIEPGSKEMLNSCYSNILISQDTPYLWMNAAEVAFLRAEYELRWGSSEQARAWYEKGIVLSFEEKGASGAEDYISDYISRPEGYNSSTGSDQSHNTPLSTATIAWAEGESMDIKEQNLEKIIIQKWIAIFPLGMEAWAEHRRTGYPKLFPAVSDMSGGTVDLAEGPGRLTYPVEEYDLNTSNLNGAITLLNKENSSGKFSGDVMGTRVWWDCAGEDEL